MYFETIKSSKTNFCWHVQFIENILLLQCLKKETATAKELDLRPLGKVIIFRDKQTDRTFLLYIDNLNDHNIYIIFMIITLTIIRNTNLILLFSKDPYSLTSGNHPPPHHNHHLHNHNIYKKLK